MRNKSISVNTEAAKAKQQENHSEVKVICNGCNVAMVFNDQDSHSIRKQVADLLVTAFERQIGVREAV